MYAKLLCFHSLCLTSKTSMLPLCLTENERHPVSNEALEKAKKKMKMLRHYK